MKLENQVCSFEQAKKLKDLGIKQDSLFYHFPNPNTEEIKKKYKLPDYNVVEGSKFIPSNQIKDVRAMVLDGIFPKTYSAFTVAELSVMLGNNYPSWSFNKNGKKWIATVINKNEKRDGKNITTAPEFDRYAETQADALATLLIATIEIDFMKPKEINKRLLTS